MRTVSAPAEHGLAGRQISFRQSRVFEFSFPAARNQLRA
jgi:hypothetical protein